MSEKLREALEPCPFCGGHAIVSEPEWNDSGMWSVDCDGNLGDMLPGGGGYCGASVQEDTKELAIAAWNRRAPIRQSGGVVQGDVTVGPAGLKRISETIMRAAKLFVEMGYITESDKPDVIHILTERIGYELSYTPAPTVQGESRGVDLSRVDLYQAFKTSAVMYLSSDPNDFSSENLDRAGIAGVVSALLAHLQQAPQGSGWIPVTERLPDVGVPVMTMYHDKIAGDKTPMLAFAMRDIKGWLTFVSDNDAWDQSCYSERWYVNYPTHWQPLPPPPRSE